MIFTVLGDTSRHTGHADISRESMDGRIGMNATITSTPSPEDGEYWRLQLARMPGAIDQEQWMVWNRARLGYDPTTWTDFLRRTWGCWADHPAVRD